MNIGTTLKFAAVAAILFATFVKAEPKKEDFTPEFVAQCKAKAETGDAEGQALYGHALSNGWGVEKDATKAVEWYRKAAEQGDVTAQKSLGDCYRKGIGVGKDEAKANEWYSKAVECYRKAAEQGDAMAQYKLGECYDAGTGVEKDAAKAIEWYRKAAEKGNWSAKNRLKNIEASPTALKEKAEKKIGETFVVNGFYVGMPIDDAVALVKGLLPDRKIRRTYFVNGEKYDKPGIWLGDESQPFCIEKNGVVTTIQIPKDLVKAWLNLKAYSYDEWAKKFASQNDLELSADNYHDYVSRGGSFAEFDQTVYNFGVLKGCKITYFGKDEGKYRRGDDLEGVMFIAGFVEGTYLSMKTAKEGTLRLEQAEEL